MEKQRFFFKEASLPYSHFRILFPSIGENPNDNATQIAEVELYGSPTSPAPEIVSLTREAGDSRTQTISLLLRTKPQTTYRIQWSNDLNIWNNYERNTESTGFFTQRNISEFQYPKRFYRVIEITR